MKQEKSRKSFADVMRVLKKKKDRFDDGLNCEDEDSELLMSLDELLESDGFQHGDHEDKHRSNNTPKIDALSSEMLDDVLSLVNMVEHMEQVMELTAIGKMCPLRGLRDASEMVDHADSIVEKWYQYFSPEA